MNSRGRIAGLAALLMGIVANGEALADAVAKRGRYLVESIMACGNCHTPRGPDGKPAAGRTLAGGILFDTPAFLAQASNITPDRQTGLGLWSDADVKRAVVEGIKPRAGAPLAAVMPSHFYKVLTPDDLDAVVTHLRRSAPVREASREPVYRMPVQRDAYPDASATYTADALKDPVTRGRYLATIGHCMDCHTPKIRGASDFAGSLGKGGRAFGPPKEAPPGTKPVVSRNITQHRTAGIGGWTDAEIKRAITKGVSRDGSTLKPPMAYAAYAKMSRRDLEALVAWLRTVPPLE